MRWVIAGFVLGVACTTSGCGTSISTIYPNSIIGADGQPLVLDDLEAVANDSNLTSDQKRQAFRDLGLFDEELINALLDL